MNVYFYFKYSAKTFFSADVEGKYKVLNLTIKLTADNSFDKIT